MLLLRVSLLLATLPPALLGATSTESDGRSVVEDLYRRYNSSRAGADLVFLLDRSGSVSRRLWMSMINFVKVAGHSNSSSSSDVV